MNTWNITYWNGTETVTETVSGDTCLFEPEARAARVMGLDSNGKNTTLLYVFTDVQRIVRVEN